jgi:hypothetical protein
MGFTSVFLLANGLAEAGKPGGCVTIQSGELYASNGSLLEVGYNEWDYNYQAHMYNDDTLDMKWSDSWLSNKDCDGDGLLDRHYGFDSYIGSGAWLTNHEKGSYIDEWTGKTCRWEYFVKIIAAPGDAYAADGIWYDVDGNEIGPVIWGSFAIIQEVVNDNSCVGIHGVYYLSPAGPGLGHW